MKGIDKQIKRKNLQNTYLINNFCPEYIMNCKLNNKKTMFPIKTRQKIYKNTSPKKIYRCQILDIMEILIKTSVRYNYLTVKMAKIF